MEDADSLVLKQARNKKLTIIRQPPEIYKIATNMNFWYRIWLVHLIYVEVTVISHNVKCLDFSFKYVRF